MHLTIRRAVAGDADAAGDLYLRSRRAAAQVGSIPPPAHPDDAVAEWIALVVIPKLECWLAETKRCGVVGMLVLRDEWIDQLYVDPDLTGRGIGAALLDRAKRERPCGLRLWAFVSNEGAQRFYERHGFTELERTDGSRNEEHAPAVQYVWRPALPAA